MIFNDLSENGLMKILEKKIGIFATGLESRLVKFVIEDAVKERIVR